MVLCDLRLENGSMLGDNKSYEISKTILDILEFIIMELPWLIVYLTDDFEAILNLL